STVQQLHSPTLGPSPGKSETACGSAAPWVPFLIRARLPLPTEARLQSMVQHRHLRTPAPSHRCIKTASTSVTPQVPLLTVAQSRAEVVCTSTGTGTALSSIPAPF